jgi:hypothetical protein
MIKIKIRLITNKIQDQIKADKSRVIELIFILFNTKPTDHALTTVDW